jgi:hypothetical protein
MKKTKDFWRPLVAVGLVSAMLVLPLSHAAAGQQQQYPPFSPYSQQEEQEEEPSSAAKWLGAALFVGLLYCAWTGCVWEAETPTVADKAARLQKRDTDGRTSRRQSVPSRAHPHCLINLRATGVR